MFIDNIAAEENPPPAKTAIQAVTTSEPEVTPTFTGKPVQLSEPHFHVEKIKETPKTFWSYFLHHLRHPSHIFHQMD